MLLAEYYSRTSSATALVAGLKLTTLDLTRKRTTLPANYQLHGHTLTTTREAKYLGVTISKDLRWDTHITNIANKANKSLGFLRRNLKIGSRSIKEKAFTALVRPSMEYASTVWDPYTDKNINKLEAVQRRAARWVVNRHRQTSSVDDMLRHLQWPTLQERRKTARLITMYKYINNRMVINSSRKPTPSRERRSNRQNRPLTFPLPYCRTDYRKQSFLPRTITKWNGLPTEVVLSSSLVGFKT